MKAFLNRIILLAVFCLTCLLNLSASAQTFSLTTYNTTSGLPGNQINDLHQDRHGRLWVATMNGAAIFNGEKFTRFEKSEPEASNPVKTIFEDSKGNIWLGMLREGIVKINNAGEKKYFRLPNGLVGDDVYAITEDGKGDIWIGTTNGLSRFHDNRFSNYTVFRGLVNNHVNAILADSKGRLWIATMGGVSMFDGNRFTNFTIENGLTNNSCASLHEDLGGRIRVGTYSGVCTFLNGRFFADPAMQQVNSDRIEEIFQKGDNAIVTSTFNNGLAIFSKNGFQRINTSENLPSNIVKSAIIDREGIYWIGTWSGLCKWNSEKFTQYTHENGLSNNNLLSLSADPNNGVYFGTLTGGLNKLSDGVISSIGSDEGLGNLSIWCQYTDTDGQIWIGTESGPAMLDPLTKKTTFPYLELNYLNVFSINRNLNGELLLGTEDGLFVYPKSGESRKIGVKDGLPDGPVKSIISDAGGRIWIGTGKGLFISENGITIDANKKFGLQPAPITSISFGSEKTIIVCSNGSGCHIINPNGNLIQTLDENLGLSNNVCLSAFVDSRQRLWIGTSSGVDVMPFNEGKIQDTLKIFHFNYSNGYNGGETNSIREDISGNIWFATSNGAIKFPVNASLPSTSLPVLRISSVALLLSDIDWKNKKITPDSLTGLPNNLVLPYNNNHITFNFEGAFLAAPNEVEYQYILENFDNGWSPSSSRPVAIYSNLDAGTYTFKVKASANGRDWTSPVLYTFTVKPPFWKTTFFYFLYAASAIGFVFGFSKWRTRNLEQKRNELIGLVNERTKELNEKNKQLEKLSIVASETDNSVMIFDSKGRVEWVNEGFTKLTGFELNDILSAKGNGINDFTFYPDAINLLESCIKDKKSELFEANIVCKNGWSKWVSNTLTPVFNEEGEIEKTVVIATDITLRKNMEERIRESLEEKGLLLRE
ncbi:MAG: two-component regulator propeller domain-containing protein, partial [Bacteroidota bacterium]